MKQEQVHVLYSGNVQGVGFRYRCRLIAADFRLNGWVKNLADGRVELSVQGPKDIIEGFLERLESSFKGYIRTRQLSWGAADMENEGFSIKF